MLYNLLYPLSVDYSVLNIFKYITFRSAWALVTALAVSILVGPYFIRWLQAIKCRQEILKEVKAHQCKAGTPTMGGLLIVFAVSVSVLLWADLTNAYDEKGNLNKKAAIEAQMKLAETLQAGINYGQGDREIYNSYDEYIQTLHWLQTPLLTDGFVLKNLSSLSLTQEGGSSQIEAMFTPAALKQLFEQEIDGTVTAVLVLADDGSVELLRWEQVEVIDDYPTTIACGEYSFWE